MKRSEEGKERDQKEKNQRTLKLERMDPAWSAEEMRAYFGRVTTHLLQRTFWRIGKTRWVIRELEVYVNGGSFCDFFTHGHEVQKQTGSFYFHRSGKSYRGGTYKGIDIVVGCDKVYGGLLVRTIENMESKEVVCGPSLCVDKILEVLGCPSIEAAVDKHGICFENGGDFCLCEMDPRDEKIYSSIRIGLSLKAKSFDETVARFWADHLRFVVNPKKITKHKQYLVLALLRDGNMSTAQIAAELGAASHVVEEYKKAFEEGKKMDPKVFFGKKFSVPEICQAYGCLSSKLK